MKKHRIIALLLLAALMCSLTAQAVDGSTGTLTGVENGTRAEDATAVQALLEPVENETHAALSGTWIKASNGKWWYKYSNGTYPANGWAKIDGCWYYFDADGWMQTGWLWNNSKWYYLGTDGAMVTGWKQIDGEWYYFWSGGSMATGWVQDNGTWYYLQSSGAMVTGRWIINGKYQKFSSNGAWQYRYIPDYSRSAAIYYADKWALVSNEEYMYYINADCTNYVSQCLYAGGMKQDSTWQEPGYLHKVPAWSTAPELRNYLLSERVATLLSVWAISQTITVHGEYAYGCEDVFDSNQLTSSNTGKVVLFYDWKGEGDIDHAAFFVANNELSSVHLNNEQGQKGDLINQHTTDRKHALWIPYKRDPDKNRTIIYGYEINTD